MSKVYQIYQDTLTANYDAPSFPAYCSCLGFLLPMITTALPGS